MNVVIVIVVAVVEI